MKRARRILPVVLLAAVVAVSLAALLPASVPSPAAVDRKPNVVLVLVDDMRTDELAFLPHTRRLMAEDGVWFRHAISPHPLCCPARAELVTGQYAQNNGVQHNRGPHGGFRALEGRSHTIGAWLQEAGYRTSYIGKYLNGYRGREEPEPGWDRWEALDGDVSLYTRFRFFGDDEPRTGYIADEVARRSEDVVRDFSAADDPFFLFVNHSAPHSTVSDHRQTPPTPAPEYADLPVDTEDLPFLDKPSYDEADVRDLPRELRKEPVADARIIEDAVARVRALQSVDDAMDGLFATLEETGELDDSVVVFTSDNGYVLGEHRLYRKDLLVRESLDVPLLVSGTGVVGGRTEDRIVSLVDLPATVLDLADARASRPVDGRSLVPLLQGTEVRWRDTTLVQTGSTESGGPAPGWAYRGVQTDRYLYALNADHPGTDYLFDRARDPYELRNVVDEPRYAAVVAELRRRAEVLMTCAGESCNQRFGPLPDVGGRDVSGTR